MTLTHPVSDVEEALLAGEIKHQQEPHGIPEECRCQAAEPGTHRKTIFL